MLREWVAQEPDAGEYELPDVEGSIPLCMRQTALDEGELAQLKNLCSAETVGRFRFRKPTQRVIKGDFHGIVGAKTVRTSGHHTKFVVEALDGTVGDLAFGPKPVQQQLLMGA